MKLIMTLLVRDEEDIVRENIEFHLAQGVDFIIATDNLSTDSTADIIREYEKQGVLKYLFEKEDNYNQHAWVTKMARLASTQYKADWVINNDADEFWWPIEGNLQDTFESIQEKYKLVIAKRNNFVAMKGTPNWFYKTMIYKEVESLNSIGKPLPPKVAHRGDASIVVEQGNHNVEGGGKRSSVKDIVEIFHFPIRRKDQLLNKIIKGGAAYDRNTQLGPGIGKTWRELFRQYNEQGNLDTYLDKEILDKNEINEKLKSGQLIVDERLKNYLERLRT